MVLIKVSKYGQRVYLPSKVAQVFWDAFDDILVVSNGDEGDARDFPDSAFQVFIIRADEVASMLLDPVDEAVISIGTFVGAREPLEAGVLGQLEG